MTNIHSKNVIYFSLISFFFSLALPPKASAQIAAKWIAVGSLHEWYSPMGCEEETGFVNEQQYGLQWPAIYKHQDAQVAKGFWIAVNDHHYPAGAVGPAVVHMGPRVHGTGEFFPVKFETVSKFTPPQVTVNGAASVGKPVANDRVDSTIRADRMIVNVVNTALGITMTRTIMQFGQQFHDNYIIYDFVFSNTGNTNADPAIENPSQVLSGVYFYFLYRYAVCADTRFVIGQNPTGWGINTMSDVRGDGTAPSSPFFTDPVGNGIDYTMRASYSWHGKYPPFTLYNNIGGPVWTPYYDKTDTTGRLGAAQFVGVATLHADKSASDTSDDATQPSTTSYEGSDESNTAGNDFTNPSKAVSEYAWVTRGHRSPRFADKVGPTGDPAIGTPGGWSSMIGYGPYTLEPGKSIHIVQAEAMAGLSREACVEIGRAYKNGKGGNPGAPIPYNDGSKVNGSHVKDDWVYTGRDSLFLAFNRAAANANAGYSIPQPPRPPKTFSVTHGSGSVQLNWDVYDPVDPSLKGFEIYRAEGRVDSTYRKVLTAGASTRSYIDLTAKRGIANFYYIVSVGDAANNNGVGMTLSGALKSNRFYTQTYDSILIPMSVGQESSVPAEFALHQNYPNPFNPNTVISYHLPAGQAGLSVNSVVTLRIFDVLGREVSTLVNERQSAGTHTVDFSGDALSGGVYFYQLQAGTFAETRKMLLLK